jgi:DNA-binding response OmpR family regulator
MVDAAPALIAGRATWLVLAEDGPAAALPAHVREGVVQVTSSAIEFDILLRETRPRLAVLGAPPADAEELELLARERRQRTALRAVLVNAPLDVAARLHALELGIDEAVPATISPVELAGRLRVLADRARQRAPMERAIPVADGAALDLLAHELRRDGEAVHLRPKEFRLLALLATHPGRAYTRHELLQRVWGAAYGGDARTIDVHVRWIRSKIESDPDRPVHLVTVRGTGYRLDPPLR